MRSVLNLVVSAYIMLSFISQVTAQSFNSDAWRYRMKITFAGYDRDETLTNFPVLITLNDSIPGFDYADFNSPSGADLRFCPASGNEELNYEIEQWDVSGDSFVWVQIPELGGPGDFIYMYWQGETAVPDYTTNGATWSEEFAGVWHLSDADTTALDSTANLNNPYEIVDVVCAPGMIGDAGWFNGSTSRVLIPTSQSLEPTCLTMSLWAEATGPGSHDSNMIFCKGIGSGGQIYYSYLLRYLSNTEQFGAIINNGLSLPNGAGLTDTQARTLVHLAATFQSGQYKLYCNGVITRSAGTGGEIYYNMNNPDLHIGEWGYGSYTRRFEGMIDDVRVSNVVRSSNWLWACWFNQESNSLFNSYGAVESSENLTVIARDASDIEQTSATLNGQFGAMGGATDVHLYFCLDTSDRGVVSTGDWNRVIYMGTGWTEAEAFVTNITGLVSGETYAYRCFITHSGGTVWSDTVAEFSTIGLPAAENPGALAWGHRTALLRGEVTNPGGDAPDTCLLYWENNSSITSTIAMGLQTGPFEATVDNLVPGAVYHYRISVSNIVGISWSDTESFSTHPAGAALYTATNGNHTSGANWTGAYSDLATVLAIAEPGDTIYIAGHTFAVDAAYEEESVYRWHDVSDVTLRGGYAAADNQDLPGARDSDQWQTIIARASGDNRARVMEFANLDNCLLEQIIVRDGNLSGCSNARGGGILLSACTNITISDCMITDNNISEHSSPLGGGIALVNSVATLTNCVISHNRAGWLRSNSSASSRGGGVYVDGDSSLNIMNSLIHSNLSAAAAAVDGFGGGIYASAGGVINVRDTTLSGNRMTRSYGAAYSQTYGAAMAAHGSIYARNVLIIGNESTLDSNEAIFSGGPDATMLIENATIAYNNNGVGIRYGGGVIGITNCILWGHTEDLADFPVDGGGLLLNVGYSLFNEPANMDGVNGCVRADPYFVDAVGGDYRLQTTYGRPGVNAREWIHDSVTSPAIDAGVNLGWHESAFDLDGTNRLKCGRWGNPGIVDMGVYEQTSQPPGTIYIAL